MNINKINVNNADSNYAHSIFDITEYNSGAKYDDLIEALEAMPSEKRQGGMTVRYVEDTSVNNYVQYQYMLEYENTTAGNEAFLDISNWKGVDNEPVPDSESYISSGAVAKFIHGMAEDDERLFTLVDNAENILLEITKDKVLKTIGISLDIDSDFAHLTKIDTDNKYFVWTDEFDNILAEIKDGRFYVYGKNIDINNIQNSTGDKTEDGVYELYRNKQNIVQSVCNYKMSNNTVKYQNESVTLYSKRLQFLITTDSHTSVSDLTNASILAKNFGSIDAIVSIGDLCTTIVDSYDLSKEAWIPIQQKKYLAFGNHDVGEYSRAIQLAKSDKQLYDDFIAPNYGSFAEGESYVNKCYWYRDFNNFNTRTRLIGLFPFDDGCEIDDEIWKPLSYYSDVAEIEAKHYNVGDVVNVPGYTEHSFQAVVEVDVKPLVVQPSAKWKGITYDSSLSAIQIGRTYNEGDKVNDPTDTAHAYSYEAIYDNVTVSSVDDYPAHGCDNDTHPHYKALRGNRWYGEDQLNWFVSLLKSAAAANAEDRLLPSSVRRGDYLIVIAQHFPVFDNNHCVVDDTKVFNNDFRFYNDPSTNHGAGVGGNYSQRFDSDKTDIIAMIINAYYNKTSLGSANNPLHFKAKSGLVVRSTKGDGYRSYDDCSGIPEFDFYCDFSDVEYPSKVTFISGHDHGDGVIRHISYDDMMNIIFTCGIPLNPTTTDITKNTTEGKLGYDTFTSYTVFPDGVHVSRIGNDAARKKTGNRIAYKDNEFINF